MAQAAEGQQVPRAVLDVQPPLDELSDSAAARPPAAGTDFETFPTAPMAGVEGGLEAESAPPPALETPASPLQARIDEAICIRDDDGQTFRNCFASSDGTAMRQFVVSDTGGVRCAICCDDDAPFALSSRTPLVTQLHDMKKHCGQYASERNQPQARAHLERLRLLSVAPSPAVEASTTTPAPPSDSTTTPAPAPSADFMLKRNRDEAVEVPTQPKRARASSASDEAEPDVPETDDEPVDSAAATPSSQPPFAVGTLVADVDAPEHALEVVSVDDDDTYTLKYRDAGAWRGQEVSRRRENLVAFGSALPRRRRAAAPPVPKAKPAPPPAPTKKKKPAAKARRVTQSSAAKPVNAPEGAVFDHAARLGGEWVSPRRPGGPKGPAPLWCLWHDDMDLVDDDDVDTPLGKGCWEVRWSDRTGSYLARDDVRLCVPTRERLAQAPTPPPKRLAQAPPRPPRPPTPPPAPAPANEGVEDESYDPFGKDARVKAPWSDGKLYAATVLRVYKSSLRVQFDDDSVGSAPREECELLEPAPRAVRLTDEDKRERQELRAMAAADKPALLALERCAMAQHDKPRYRAVANRRQAVQRDWRGDITAVDEGLISRMRRDDDTVNGVCARLAVGGVFLSSRFDGATQAEKALAVAAAAQRCVLGGAKIETFAVFSTTCITS